MPNVMFRQQADGLYCYIAKRDLEAKITSMEFESAECWGGGLNWLMVSPSICNR